MSGEARGIALRILSGLLFTAMAAVIKAVGNAATLGEVVFFRSAVAMVPLVIFLWFRGEFPQGLATRRPFVVAGFMDTLLKDPAGLSGLRSGGVLIVNTTKSPQEIRELLDFQYDTVGCLDATSIALEEKSRINTAMQGALAQLVSFMEVAAVREVLAATFERKHPSISETNLRTFDRGAAEIKVDRRGPAG